MKVQYLKKHTDEHGFVFESGWTAEHTDAEAQRRIDDGICQKVADGAYPRRQEVVVMECAVPSSNTEKGFFLGAILKGDGIDEKPSQQKALTQKK